MMTKIPEVLKSGSGKRWVWITGVVAIFALLFAIAWNIECERAVAPQELPGEARSFIAQHYPEENPVLVIKTLDELAVTYKVVFADGTQVKFRRNGMWREIKSRSRAVPSAVVPAQIADYVARNFPGTFLVGIEHTCREWEVKLNNTIELTFDDKRFALKEYDDVPLSRKWGVYYLEVKTSFRIGGWFCFVDVIPIAEKCRVFRFSKSGCGMCIVYYCGCELLRSVVQTDFCFPFRRIQGGDGLSLQMVVKSGCSHRCIGGVRRIIFKLNIEIGSCGMEDACGKVKTKPPGKAA